MLLFFELLALLASAIVLWSVSGLIINNMDSFFYKAFGKHFF